MNHLRARSSHCLWRACIALLLILTMGCSSKPDKTYKSLLDPGVVRYRLKLRENPVDPGAAFRCYGGCQESKTPDIYMACLQECPGFEVNVGLKCADYEVPPIAACLNARKMKVRDEMAPGYVVLSVLAGVAVVVALSSVCASSMNSQCGYGLNYY